jgi:DNA-binding IclR family transcriptional regulator
MAWARFRVTLGAMSDLNDYLTTQLSKTARGSSGAQAIERAFAILRFVAGTGKLGARLSDVVAHTGLAQPTVHRMLRALESEGAVLRSLEGKRYVIGPELTLLGLSTGLRELRSVASPFLERLCTEVGDAVFMSIASGRETVCADRRIGSYPIQVISIDIGSRRPLGVSVNGIAILSRLDPEKTQHIIDANAERFGDFNVPKRLVEERVEQARQRGYVYVEAALVKNTRAVSVPVVSVAGTPIAAISTIAITRRIPAQRVGKLVSLLRTTADDISRSVQEASTRRR